MQAFVLAGGRGTRLAPYTVVFPKPMLPVGGQPIIQTIINQLADFGFTDIVISLGYLGDLIELFFKDKRNRPDGVTIRYVREEKPLGTAGALALAKELHEDFLVINGDILTSLDYSQMMSFHRKRQSILTIAVGIKKVSLSLGIISMDDKDQVTGIEEKPTYSFLDNMGIYVYNRKAVTYIPKTERTDVNLLIEKLVADKQPVYGYRSDEPYYWIDIGQHAEYEKANTEFTRNRKAFLKSRLYKEG
jgi:NDP-sugar pyrophosphorylase family protein